eukprot:CAMPEP_0114255748 /NCGR_PEP_ID=MMETSP0058-20121206/17740_1 /TAXON_ID=36894 /ORGANISM="Pyramimonas parkeae, CCMP726" /LENGTH=642 /DNA_ID=CAMNT_0001370179 /DNA_START=41 /DNA_END=1969 /DNA_ORIENTATION=+
MAKEDMEHRDATGSLHASDTLKDENVDLKRKLAELRLKLQLLEGAKDSEHVVKCGYLHKYRPFSGGLFSPSWALRFFSLVSKTLLYYKSEQDTTMHPRGRIDLGKSVTVEVEGYKVNKFWTFSLIDPEGGSLLRLSTENQADGEVWVAAFQNAGCTVVEAPAGRATSPRPPSKDLRYRGKGQTVEMMTRKKVDVGVATTEAPSEEKEEKPREWRASFPVHKSRYSILSSERLTTQNHHGLLNLAAVILVVTNSRLIMENVLKYGFRAGHFAFWFAHPLRAVPLLVTWVGLSVFAAIALAVELAAVHLGLHDYAAALVQAVNCGFVLFVPCTVINFYKPDIWISVLMMMVVLTLFMKLISYAHVNHDLRRLRRQGTDRAKNHALLQLQLQDYPANLTIGNMAYFLLAPTLCYQTNYPRSSRLRKRWLFRRIVEAVICVALMIVLIEQYIHPASINSIRPLRDLDFGRILERLLKLSIPVLYFWLVMFYVFFHLWMNILGEVLCFADREFYRDWWNANNIEQYWRLWNMPVHMWLVRHIYFPCMYYTKSRQFSIFVVFFLSAVFHELAIGVPMRLMRGWAFFGILSQIPLIQVSQMMNTYLKNEQAGNFLFWFTFCILGQPMGLMLYMHDYSAQQQAEGTVLAS